MDVIFKCPYIILGSDNYNHKDMRIRETLFSSLSFPIYIKCKFCGLSFKMNEDHTIETISSELKILGIRESGKITTARY